ncbi:4-oxalomesaconate tautomerase [Aestuariibius insulae]|uniref:4-oxalomesaconate tautomerase n=1 Tax=Aestuariibius insulae TaxID=2058287 RepID=UPI00345E6669
MTQTPIPFLLMRGGTSRGAVFHRSDLPEDLDHLSKVLISAMGGGHPRNIDGLGGGNATTTKVGMLSVSDDPEADVDYFFAQVAVEKHEVDYKPTCGNVLVGVGPAAIEMGLVPVAGDVTSVRIRAVNTGAIVHVDIQTPNGAVTYDGDTAIDGVPGTAAPVAMTFTKITGARTGKMFPTGSPVDVIDGIDTTLIDVAMPMMIARASDLGITGYESQADLDASADLFTRLEALRLKAGERMGLGDVSASVIPKIGLVTPAKAGGDFAARYFMPWTTHPTLAITGGQCLAACALAPGTVAEGLMTPRPSPLTVQIEHPSGLMEVHVHYDATDGFDFISAGVTRTARLIARGEVMIPKDILS